jgi:hypothetical protein
MNKQKVMKIVLILISIMIITACNLPVSILTGDEGGQNDGTSTKEPGSSLFPSTNKTEEPEKINPNPVGIQDGLGSLDSYQMKMYVNMHDSKGTKYEVNSFAESSVIDKNSHTLTSMVNFDPANDTEESTSTTESYMIGNVTCSSSGEEWTYSEISDQDKEFRDIFTNMVDFLPLIDNPVFVGEENVNGIDTNHFTFKVEGIGATSGSVATVNNGDYWLAKDGQYIVKYHLVLEIRSAAEGTADAEVINLETSVDVTNINVPISLTIPAGCAPAPAE